MYRIARIFWKSVAERNLLKRRIRQLKRQRNGWQGACTEGEDDERRTQDKPHLSYSQINTYCTCPLKYRFHYIDQIEPPFTAAPLAFGSAIHEAVGAFYQSCLEGEPLSAGQGHDVYRQAWESHANERPIRFSNGDSEESLTAKAKRMLEVFHESFDPLSRS